MANSMVATNSGRNCSVGAHSHPVAALVIGTIDQQVAHGCCAHFPERDFLLACHQLLSLARNMAGFSSSDLQRSLWHYRSLVNTKPINPTTSRTAPATISQSRYSIAESMFIGAALASSPSAPIPQAGNRLPVHARRVFLMVLGAEL